MVQRFPHAGCHAGTNGAPPKACPSTISSSTPPASASRASHAREKRLRFFMGGPFPLASPDRCGGRSLSFDGRLVTVGNDGSTGCSERREASTLMAGVPRMGGPHSGVLPFVRHPALGQPNLPNSRSWCGLPSKKRFLSGPTRPAPDAPSAQPADPLPVESVAIYRHVGEDGTVFLTNRRTATGGISFSGCFSAERLMRAVGPDGVARLAERYAGQHGVEPGWSWRSQG